VLADLQRRTALQSNFGAILLALVDGQPLQLSLRQLLRQFLEYREHTLLRRTRHALRKCEDRLEVVEGLIRALDELRRVIEMIQEARDAASARASLQVHLDLSERQADAVLAMPLRRLTALEQDSLRQEAEDLRRERTRLRHLLDDRGALLDTLVAEFRGLKKRYATPRRTRLVEGGDELTAQRSAAQRPNAELQRRQALDALASDARLLIQADGAVKILAPQTLGRLHLEDSAASGDHPAPARLILPVQRQPQVLAFTADGRVALLRWEFAGQQPGPLERFLPDSLEGSPVLQLLALPDEADGSCTSLGLLSSDGRCKRLPLEAFQELSGRAATVLKLREGVTLSRVVPCREGGELVVATSTGRLLRLAVNEADLPLMGRTAQGPMLLRLLPGEAVVGAAGVQGPEGSVLLASRRGWIKRLPVAQLRLCQRGDLGQIGLRFSERQDRLADLCDADAPLVAALLSNGHSTRLEPRNLEAQDTDATGLNLGLADREELQALVPLER
jgi:DNA gyrase subunit A